MHLSQLEHRADRHPTGPSTIYCPNGTLAATSHTDLGMALAREVLRQYGYEVAG